MKAIPCLLLLLAPFIACHTGKSSSGKPGGSETLYMYQWDLQELRGKPVEITDRVHPHLLLSPGQENRVGGSIGCNKLAGTFTLEGTDQIHFSPLITTKMACPDQALETDFSRALGQADHWEVADKMLYLKLGDKVLASFKGVTPPSNQ